MNATELTARRWLARQAGVAEEEVVFSSSRTPDFVMPDGSKYEVKRLYRDKIILYPSQVRALREQDDIIVIIFSDGNEKPTATILAKILVQALDRGENSILNIKLVVTEDKVQFYLGEKLQESFERYIEENYVPGTRARTAVFRKALAEFLEKEGYYKAQDKEVMPLTKHD